MKINELLFEAPVIQQTVPAAVTPAVRPAGMIDKAVGGMAKVAGGINRATSAVQKGFNKYQQFAKGGQEQSTPFDNVDSKVMVNIIDKVLAGKTLDSVETMELKNLRRKL